MRFSKHPNRGRARIENELSRIAEGISDQAELDHLLMLVPDPGARAEALAFMKPLLKFTPHVAKS